MHTEVHVDRFAVELAQLRAEIVGDLGHDLLTAAQDLVGERSTPVLRREDQMHLTVECAMSDDNRWNSRKRCPPITMLVASIERARPAPNRFSSCWQHFWFHHCPNRFRVSVLDASGNFGQSMPVHEAHAFFCPWPVIDKVVYIDRVRLDSDANGGLRVEEKWDAIVPDAMLADKVIVISGGSQGIGESAAYGFARAGATVVIGARRAHLVEKHAAAIDAFGGHALGLELDVTKEDSWKSFIDEAVGRFGRIDGAFNNAGIDQKPAILDQVSLQEWRDVFAVKVDGTFLGVKYQSQAMGENGGAIVNHGSAVAETGIDILPAPCASQAAVIGLTKSAARAYGPKIRINLLSTGAVLTPERQGTEMYSEIPFVPAKRMGRAQEIAAAAAWLLSDYASYQTGSIVTIDGGGPSWDLRS